jgi:hypothetical protein
MLRISPKVIDYATSSSPTGPWTHRGRLNDQVPNCPTNHPAIIEFQNQWYFIYHNGNLPGGGEYRRSVCIDYLYYNSDGTMQKVIQTQEGVDPVGSDPTPVPTPDPTPPPQSQDPVWSGGPYTLDGVDDYVDVPDNITADIYDFTVAAWVNLNSVDTWSRIFDFGRDTTYNMFLTPSSDTGAIRFTITTTGNSDEQQINGSGTVSTGSWQYVAVVKNGNTGILYMNGNETGRNSNMTLRPADLGNTVNNYIGRSQYADDPYLNGSVDDFFIYNRPLSSSEISSLAINPPGTSTSKGDANGDGVIDIVDALLIAQCYVGLSTCPPGSVGDANCDGTIDIVDALLVAQYYVGLIAGFCLG